MEDDSSLRLVQKLFKCPLCLRGFKKLVHVNEQFSKCPECGHEHCSEMINSEFNRESVDSQYRLPFCNLPEDVRRQYHTVTDIHDKSPNNFYLDARRNEPHNNNNNINNNNNYNYNNNNRYTNNSPEITFGYYDFASGIRQLIDQRKTFFILMYGSTDYRGVSWCSDCNFAEPLIQNAKRIVLSKQSERQVFWINIPIEKEKRHAYKIDSYLRMMYVPTLIYYENGIEIGRIVQEQMFTQESINNFILRAYRQNYY